MQVVRLGGAKRQNNRLPFLGTDKRMILLRQDPLAHERCPGKEISNSECRISNVKVSSQVGSFDIRYSTFVIRYLFCPTVKGRNLNSLACYPFRLAMPSAGSLSSIH